MVVTGFRLHKATLNSSRPTVFLNMNSINNYFQCYPLHLIHLLNHKTLTNYLINASHTAALALPNPLLLMHNVIHIAEDVDISLCFQLNDWLTVSDNGNFGVSSWFDKIFVSFYKILGSRRQVGLWIAKCRFNSKTLVHQNYPWKKSFGLSKYQFNSVWLFCFHCTSL